MKTKSIVVPARLWGHTLFALALLLLAPGCTTKNADLDQDAPEISLDIEGAFPQQCATVTRGQHFTFRALLKDNAALGSFNLDMHHNFDQHGHSTETGQCSLDAPKTPVKPFVFIQSYEIPPQQTQFLAEAEIRIPADADQGDYHFTIQVTDAAGWSTRRSLSIKIVE